MSVVNTTDNTYLKDGVWQSDMGPLSGQYGLACDNTVKDMRFHSGEYRHWYLAPSDSIALLGLKKCAKNANGEPSCSENWNLCGRKVRVKCLDPEFCGKYGNRSLLSQINSHKAPVNNYVPEVLVQELTQRVGRNPKVANSMVLYITDFCPSDHSNNKRNNQCQGPQVDLSTSAFLMMGKANDEGYINTNMKVSIELLDENDSTPVGPRYQ